MRLLIQRVLRASVSKDGEILGAIGRGLVVLVGFRSGDDESALRHLGEKLAHLRILEDSAGKMNLSLLDLGWECLIVSQFTLYGDTRKGNRPSFTEAEKPEQAERLYRLFIGIMKELLGEKSVQEGEFGATMQVELVNDGPVTLMLEK